MRYCFLFYAKSTNDAKLLFNASKIPPTDAYASKRHYKDKALRI